MRPARYEWLNDGDLIGENQAAGKAYDGKFSKQRVNLSCLCARDFARASNWLASRKN